MEKVEKVDKKETLNTLLKDAAQKTACSAEDFYKDNNLLLYSDKKLLIKLFGNNIVMRA